jgi:lipopolysaccharide/colanic/teichoic acid biosynthesis glycosyltransferase
MENYTLIQTFISLAIASILGILMAPAFFIIAIATKLRRAPKASAETVYLPSA